MNAEIEAKIQMLKSSLECFVCGLLGLVATDWISLCSCRPGDFRKRPRPAEEILECGQALLDLGSRVRFSGNFCVGRCVVLDSFSRLNPDSSNN